MSEEILSVTNASKHFLGLRAVDDVSLSVSKGEIVSIIGPNGAGKTTFFNLLTGQLAPTAGLVRLRGERINQLAPHARAQRGMGRTFQISKPLIALNALENVMIGAFMRHRKLSVARDKAMAVLEKVGLLQHARRRACCTSPTFSSTAIALSRATDIREWRMNAPIITFSSAFRAISGLAI